MPRIWLVSLFRFGLLCVAGLFVGWLYDQPLTGLLLALLGVFSWNLLWLYRLDRWLHGKKTGYLPDGSGIWSRVFAKIDFLKSRSKRRNKRFKALLKELRQATRSFPDGGVILRSDKTIVTMNKAAEELLGLKRKRDRGLRIENLIRNPDFVDYLRDEAFDTHVEIASPVNADIWLFCQCVNYGLDQYLLLIRDITQQYKADSMRRDFVANASHELRTPLTVITGYLDALAEDTALTPDLRQPINEIQRQSERMRMLVEELLKLSELESEGLAAEAESVDLSAVFNAAKQEARAMHDCPATIEIELNSDTELRGEVRDIQSVVSNLVSNAVRYTPADGKISIAWSTDKTGGYLTVTDSGAGIAAEHIPRLTERFYRVENGRERIGGEGGTGLGLAIVKHALYRHSATLDIQSEPGVGSKFICHFPQQRIIAASQAPQN
jgi:two-component system phosphate regulon sensor histidine kinase PhoR